MRDGLYRFNLYGMVMNYLSKKGSTSRDVLASDEVEIHLGLTGPNAGKRFLRSVSVCMFTVIILIIAVFDINDIL